MVKWNRVSFWKKVFAPYHKAVELAVEKDDMEKVDNLFKSMGKLEKIMFKEFGTWHMDESETMAVCAALEMD